ncbi:MAG: rRNA maturation RNase YbeY [Deltaproteobacteria bacterium]|nr:rRNA maturation RNase YbeY [Deltaproteobacteria bacterium]
MSVRVAGPPRGAPRFDQRLFARRARKVLAALALPRAELSLALVSDDAIAQLNEAHRGKRGPTDVLSYSLLEGAHAARRGELLGDVVIAVGVAARQAREIGHSLNEELLRLLIHGVLHLLGYDHEIARDAKRMQAKERALRKAVA